MSATLAPVSHEPASKARLRLWLRVLKVNRLVEPVLRERLRAEFGTTLPRFDVMAALNRFPEGLKMSQLSGVLRVSNGNVTGIVDRLEAEELAERAPLPGDRRAAVVRLTDKGRAEFARQAEAHKSWIDALLSDFSAEEAREIGALLGAMTDPATRTGD